MKAHSSTYKANLCKLGRQTDSKIIYELDGETIELGKSELNSITPHYESQILKSAMKQLDVDSNVEIPLGTILTYQFGVKVNNAYEYINFGNYIVYKAEKQEDKSSWNITCYDKMLYSMKDYEKMNITYPITIRDYINAICNHLGLTFANSSDTFANYDKVIDHELYLSYSETTHDYTESMGYTFRDVLDELAQVTGSTICINADDELEIRYINDTEDTIDEEYFKDINVNFGEKYGPVNSIVLSRAGGSDRVYLRDEESVTENGLCEINISENQIMNFNDRNTYLPDLLETLDGLEYYLNDFSSTGITYYEMCDKYNVSIGENIYPCIMFNDQINITQGLEENVYTEMPEESETDYTKADKTDRKINQTYIIVDKQNQVITSVVNQIGDRSEKQTTITQDIDGIASQVQDIPTITTEASGTGTITLENLVNTKLISLRIHPTDRDIIGLFASNLLTVRNGLKVLSRGVTFDSLEGHEEIYYKLPDNLYFYDNETYDEFFYDGVEEKIYVIRKVEVDEFGNKSMLETPITEEYEYQDIIVQEGDYHIFMRTYPTAFIYVKGMIKNDYTSSFATSYEVDSKLTQTANAINLEVSEKVDKSEIIAGLNVAVEKGQGIVNLKGNSVTIDSDKFKLTADGDMECNNATINGNLVTSRGVLTNLIFPCEVWSWFFNNAYTQQGGGFIGFNYDGYGTSSVIKSFLNFTVRIPQNFIVEDARIHLRHSPMTWSNPAGTAIQKGSCKNINAYITTNLGTTGSGTYLGEMDIGGNTPTFTQINQVSTMNFSDSVFQTYTTENFAEIFNNSGTYNISLKTTTSTPSTPNYDDAYYYLGRHTGILNGELEIIGYMKYNQEEESQSRSYGGEEQTRGTEEQVEEPTREIEEINEIEEVDR